MQIARTLISQSFITLAIWACGAGGLLATECEKNPPIRANLTNGSSASLSSPDGKWQLKTVPLRSTNEGYHSAILVEGSADSKKWNFGSIERWGTSFWSQDSERLFLLDAYAADDMRVRVFDFSQSKPQEITGVNRLLETAVLARIPKEEATLWLSYPEVCFAEGDSSTIIVTVDAPLALKTGGPGKDFGLKITLDVNSHKIEVTGPPAPRFP
jgi:hypothetical protein